MSQSRGFREERVILMFLAIVSVLIVLLMVTINNSKTFAEPILKDSSLRAELVAQGLHSPTSMAFLDENHIYKS
ncbi:MAG: hypothetical protein WBQ16_14300 [Nitrososphaeraceae archaeon]